MRKITFLLCIIMIVSCFSFTTSAVVSKTTQEKTFKMPDLDIEVNEVSIYTVNQIDNLLDTMNNLAIQSDEVRRSSKSSLTIINELSSIEKQYETIKSEASTLGCVFLTDEQKIQYVYGDSLPENSTKSSINYPAIQGITFSITYYTYNGVQMAKCVATQTPNTESILVKNYSQVEMYDNTKISTLVGKGVKMSAIELSSYILGSLDSSGIVNFTVNALYNLPGDIYPSSSSTSKAMLSLAVSTNSTVVHIWRYVNSDYYMRTATVKAQITESWLLRDVNGNHYYKSNVYTSYSNYYNDNTQALAVNSSQAYGIYQQYKTQGFLGFYFQKQEVTPFIAALPIHFAT